MHAQLRRDLKESLDRETDLREQLKFTEEEARTMRRKLRQAAAVERDGDDEFFDTEEDLESMTSAQKAPSGAVNGIGSKTSVDKEESETRMQLESAELEVKNNWSFTPRSIL